MFLSMYLLYRFAQSDKSLTYLVDIGLFVVLISLVSAFAPVSPFFIFMFPVSFLSFPLYFLYSSSAPSAALNAPLLRYYSVRFLTVDLHSTQFYSGAVVFAFWILLLTNVLGGVIGYLVGRRFSFPTWGPGRCFIIGFVSVLLSFLIVVMANVFPSVPLPIAGLVWISALGFGAILIDVAVLWLLTGLAEPGPRVTSLMVLGGLVLVLAGGWLGQSISVTGGWVLVVLGGVFYFAKATIDYLRISEARVREESESETDVESEVKAEE